MGYYALGLDVLQLPMSLIGSAISQVFFQRAAEARFNGTLSQIVEDTFLRLSLVGIFPILLLASIGRDLFTVIYSPTWAEAGTYTQILALGVLSAVLYYALALRGEKELQLPILRAIRRWT